MTFYRGIEIADQEQTRKIVEKINKSPVAAEFMKNFSFKLNCLQFYIAAKVVKEEEDIPVVLRVPAGLAQVIKLSDSTAVKNTLSLLLQSGLKAEIKKIEETEGLTDALAKMMGFISSAVE